jgi:hypothetical protein
LKIGSYSGNLITGEVKEIIIYTSDQSDNRFKIESNINNYYGIYNAGDQLTLPTATNLNGTLTNASSTGGTMAHTGTAYMGWEFPETLNTGAKLFVSFDLNIDSGSAGILIAGATVGVAGSGRSLNVDVNASGSYAFPLDITADGATHFRFKSQTGTYQYTVSNLRIIEGGYDGFVETWYDQSGNGNHASQASTGLQPKIVANGSYLGELDFDGVNDFLSSLDSGTTDSASIFAVNTRGTDTSNLSRPAGYKHTSDTSAKATFAQANDNTLRFDGAASSTGSQTLPASGIYLRSSFKTLTTAKDFVNGASNIDESITLASTTKQYSIGAAAANNNVAFDGNIKEVIFYNSDQSANRTAIESNIADEYGITLS